jgi:hypothetical protein
MPSLFLIGKRVNVLRMMRQRFFLISLLFILQGEIFVQAQYINNRLNIYCGYKHCDLKGKSLTSNDGVILPSLYNNMQTNLSQTIKIIYIFKEHLSFGFEFDRDEYSNWKLKNYTQYDFSKITNYSVKPLIRTNTGNIRIKNFKPFRLNFQVSPLIGFSDVELNNSLMQIIPTDGSDNIPVLSEKNLLYGLELHIGGDVFINNKLGLFINYGSNYTWLRPLFYQDHFLNQYFWEAGLFLRFFQNKRFYYENEGLF